VPRWEDEEQATYKMFEALMEGPQGGGGTAGGSVSRSKRKLLRAKERASVSPEERDAMTDFARQELVSCVCGY